MWSFRIKFLDCLSVCVNNSAVYNLHIKLFKVLDLTLCKYFNRFKFASQNFLSALQFQLYSCCFFHCRQIWYSRCGRMVSVLMMALCVVMMMKQTESFWTAYEEGEILNRIIRFSFSFLQAGTVLVSVLDNQRYICVLWYSDKFILRCLRQVVRLLSPLCVSEVPSELVHLARGGEVNLNMEDHRQEEYVKPKTTIKAFSGQGHMLGRWVSTFLETSHHIG